MDCVVGWARGEYPDSGLLLVECMVGRWFVEVEFGDDFNHLAGVSKPDMAPYVPPEFFDDELAARDFAFRCMKAIYPDIADKNLAECFEDDDD